MMRNYEKNMILNIIDYITFYEHFYIIIFYIIVKLKEIILE